MEIVPTAARHAITPERLALLVLGFAALGLLFVLRFADAQERHEMTHWQNRLGLIADSRSADIGQWLEMQNKGLSEVANNPSLQLYLTTLLHSTPQAAMQDEPAQAVFLRNLLVVTADRLGFNPASQNDLKTIRANVQRPGGVGLAILDNDGKVIVATAGLASLEASLAQKVAQAPKAQASLIDIYRDEPSGETRMGFVLPIYAIQGDAIASQQIGKLVAVKTLGNDFFRLLQQPGSMERTLEALLIRKNGDNVEYLSPSDRGAVLSHLFALSTPELDAAYALAAPGDFALKRDRLSRRVLMTSRAIAGTPWVLLLHIDRDQALAASDSWRVKTEIIMLLALLAFIASLVAVWWYATSRRAVMLSQQTGKLAAHAIAQERLLRIVTDNQPEPIFIADKRSQIRFANEKAALLFHLQAGDAIGKDLAALMGPVEAKGYMESNEVALSTQKTLLRTHRTGEGATMRVLRSEHIPLAHIPIESLAFPTPGVLVVDQDVTEIISEREKRVRILRSLIKTLVQLVDKRDPHAANHSARVALVAHEVALSLGLDRLLVDTAEIAGNLMNIGKIIVPSELLTRRAALASDEMQTIRESLATSVSVIADIDFEGPVAETLRQAAERYDGSGPLGLKGDDILITARIIAVANSFIALLSPRAWRAGNSIEQAATLLLQNIDTQFDRRVVIALINFIENKQGRKALEEMELKKGG